MRWAIGEMTGGGAHPTRGFPISAAVHIAIPGARSINPVTGTNWQGTGVVPDTAVPEAEAYDVADGEALRHVLSVVTGTSRLRVNGTSDRPDRPAESLSCERSPAGSGLVPALSMQTLA